MIHSHPGERCFYFFPGTRVASSDAKSFALQSYSIDAIMCGDSVVWVNRDLVQRELALTDRPMPQARELAPGNRVRDGSLNQCAGRAGPVNEVQRFAEHSKRMPATFDRLMHVQGSGRRDPIGPSHLMWVSVSTLGGQVRQTEGPYPEAAWRKRSLPHGSGSCGTAVRRLTHVYIQHIHQTCPALPMTWLSAPVFSGTPATPTRTGTCTRSPRESASRCSSTAHSSWRQTSNTRSESHGTPPWDKPTPRAS